MICRKILEYLDDNKIDHQDISDALHMNEDDWKKKLEGEIIITAEEYYLICKILRVELDFFTTK